MPDESSFDWGTPVFSSSWDDDDEWDINDRTNRTLTELMSPPSDDVWEFIRYPAKRYMKEGLVLDGVPEEDFEPGYDVDTTSTHADGYEETPSEQEGDISLMMDQPKDESSENEHENENEVCSLIKVEEAGNGNGPDEDISQEVDQQSEDELEETPKKRSLR
jgi:hypothetical protein